MNTQGDNAVSSGEETEIDVEIVDDSEEDETRGPAPVVVKGQLDLEPATYRIGRSSVSEADLDEYVKEELLKPTLHSWCCALGREEVPRPKPCEVVVFHDFFKVGLRFPCEDFVSEVLQRFKLHIHHLTLMLSRG